MPETNIGSAVATDLSSSFTDYTDPSDSTDAGAGGSEFRYKVENWNKHLGYYKEIPELQVAIDAEATWTVGAGFEADPATEIRVNSFSGSGKDSFNDILSNMVRTCTIAGDSFAEIIADKDEVIINLKPLDPSSITIVYGKNGRIKRYEQLEKRKKARQWKPNRIFHLSRRRIADEVHGISVIPAIEWAIDARQEAMQDWRKVLRRNVNPLKLHYLDTDDDAEVSAYKAKADAATSKFEDLYVPKGTVEIEVVTSQLNSATSPLAWIEMLKDYFFQSVNTPQIITGNAKEFTDASAKIVYLAYEQTVKSKQLYIEEQCLTQLNLEINLRFPATLQNDMISATDKEPALQGATPNDTTAELEGRQ